MSIVIKVIIVQGKLLALINYSFSACMLVIVLLFCPAYAQPLPPPPMPKFAVAQVGHETVLIMPSNWSSYATQGTIELKSSAAIENVLSPAWWNATIQTDKITFKLLQNVDEASKFIIKTNSTQVIYNYQMILNGTTYSGQISSGQDEKKESTFIRWIDKKEQAASAFIPENWSADMQIIRPYKSMTGFIFFARGSDHRLVYAFQPFMPLHMLPNDLLCETMQLCSGDAISADKVRELSFGNAPLIVSDQKAPEQYFASEILPVLRKNLPSYNIASGSSAFALTMGKENSNISLVPAYDVNYTFDADGKKVDGRAMIFTTNYTSGDEGIWNGFIVGVESLDKEFDTTFQQSAVTLLTLQFDKQWLSAEKQTLLDNVNATKGLSRISELMANDTLDDFNVLVSTAAHKMVRTYNNTMIAGFSDNATKEEMNLPLFPNSQHWYLDGDKLVGKKVGRNPMKANTLQVLFF